MPRNGSGVYSKPAGTTAVSGTAIDSADYNSTVDDLVTDANTARPVVAGGTGATTASAARTSLGLAIGSDVQAFDASLASLVGLTLAADRGLYSTAANTLALFTLTAFGRSILDDADAATVRGTLEIGDGFTATSGGAVLATIAESGLYLIQGSTDADAPGTANVHTCVHVEVSSNLASQHATDLSTGTSYQRMRTGGTWGSWDRVAKYAETLGVDQTWQDMSGSRSGSSTSYQNTTGRPIMVAIQIANAGTHEVQISSDGSSWLTLADGDSDAAMPISFIVPPSHYYRYTGGSYERWTELR